MRWALRLEPMAWRSWSASAGLKPATSIAICINCSRIKVNPCSFGQDYPEISLFGFKLSDWCRDFGWREHGGSHLIEKWLKGMMITLIDQNDFRIGASQRSRRGDAGINLSQRVRIYAGAPKYFG